MKKYNDADKTPKKKSAVALTFKIIATLLVVGAFTFCLVWTITNWDTVKNAVTNGTNIATEEDVNNAFKDGYNEGIKDKDNYSALINDYKSKYETELEKKTQLEKSVLELQSTINVLTTQKTELETQVDNLTTIKTNNENTIADLNNQITSLKFQVTTLTNSNENKAEQIEQLNTQISNLQSTVSQLQTTNDLNLQTITSLNTQIASLNTQITEMTTQSQNSNSQINALNNRINELQESINYYENYIASLETSEQVVATFEFDGSVYNIQIVNKGAKVSVIDPTSTDYVVFNYWTVDGEQIDLATYTLNTNTKIVANVTYKYDVKFVVDGANLDSQVVTQNACPTLPSNPTKDGYEFDGWTTNGVDVISNIDTTPIAQNTTYTAKFTKLHTVTFMVDSEIFDTQIVRNGKLVTLPENPTKENYDFDGWTLNENSVINISEINILADTIFTAKFTQLFTVSFSSSDNQFVTNSIIYSYQVREGELATDTAFDKPTKEYYEFVSWMVKDGWGSKEVDLSTYQIFEDTLFFSNYVRVLSIVKIYDGDQLLHSGVYNVGETLVLSDITPLGREGCYFTGYYNISKYYDYNDFITELPQQDLSISAGDYTYYAFYSEIYTGNFVSTTSDDNYLNFGYTRDYDYSSGKGNIRYIDISKPTGGSNYFYDCVFYGEFDPSNMSYYYKKEVTYTVDGVKNTGYYEYIGKYNEATDSWTFTSTSVKGGVSTLVKTETYVRSGYAYGYFFSDIIES